MNRWPELLLLAVFACCGCVAGTSLEDSEMKLVSVSGCYVAAFEVKWFKPDGIDERWWLSDPRGLIDPRMRMADGFFGGVAQLELEGHLSAKGKHGHLGQYDRNFEVTEVKRLPRDPKNVPIDGGGTPGAP